MPHTKGHKPKPISTRAFDAKFDAGKDISQHLDFTTVRVNAPDTSAQKVNVDFFSWIVAALEIGLELLGRH